MASNQPSMPWRSRAQQQQQQPAPTNNNNNNNNINRNSGGGRGNNAGFETDGQISNRTNARGNSHVGGAFQKYNNNNNNNNNNNQSSTTSQPPVTVVNTNNANTFNVEDALDAFDNIKILPFVENAVDWAPVDGSGVNYQAAHGNMASFFKMCREAQEKK